MTLTWRLGKRIIKTGIINEHVSHQEEVGNNGCYCIEITCKKKITLLKHNNIQM